MAAENAMFDMPKAGSAVPAPAVEPGAGAQERVVLLMVLLVSAAVGGALYLQFGFSPVFALIGGVVTLGVSLLANTLVARNGEIGRLRLEIARLELELARIKTQGLPNRPGQGELDTGVLVSKAALPAEARWDVAAARRARGGTGATPNGQATQGAPAPAPHPAAASPQGQQPQGAADGKAPATPATPAGQPRDPRQTSTRPPQSSMRDDVPAWAAPSADQGDALRADWERALTATAEPSQPHAAAEQEQPEAPRMPPVRSVESDLELVQRKIKALADEVNGNESARNAPAPEPSQATMDESISALRTTADRMKPRKGLPARPNSIETPQQQQQPAPRPQPAAKPSMPPPAAQPQRHPQSQPHPTYAPAGPSPASGGPGTLPSLDTLIPSTAQPIAVSQPSGRNEPVQFQSRPETIAAMPQTRSREPQRMDYGMPPETARIPEPPREAFAPEAPKPAAAPPQRTSDHGMPAQLNADRRSAPARRQQELRIAEIAAAIEHRRMDVYLNPIVGLGDYAVTHFEVDVRLRAETGGYIDNPEATLRLQATDMLALFDVERLERTARVAEQLDARGKTGAVLSPTAGQSMADGDFLEAFARTFEARTAISGQLVLTFTQADVAAFGPGTWQALADMHSFGFRFAVQQVTHLGMDFAALAERGFSFVKLPASAFLDGLPAGHGLVPPADICRHLAGAGLTLVVESIDDDQLLGRVFGFGALFGQGSLFGGSRQITLDALGPKRAA
jgi:cyclic-di-GMP phosphodiesterase TipF (flagellum assembly factor)